MSPNHDVFIDSEARWYSAYLSEHGNTRMIYAFAISLDDAKSAMTAIGAVGIVTASDGPMSGRPFVISEAARATRGIV